jgi:hypothetical protein
VRKSTALDESVSAVRSRKEGAVPWLLVPLIAACAKALPLPPPPPEGTDLVRRHFDQVCHVESESRPAIPASEIFDTLGLAAGLATVVGRPLPLDARSAAVRWRTLDFITRYARDGQLSTAGVWTTTLDSVAALVVDSILTARIQPLPGLLESEGFRTVVVFAPRPTLEVAPAVVCLPHIMHEPNQRPAGLPSDVSTWREFRSPGRLARSPRTATLRIGLDREGRVTALDSLAGDSATLAAARDVIYALHFDPALRNGEPILGELVQSFAFPPGYIP